MVASSDMDIQQATIQPPVEASSLELSIVMPCLNEADTLATCIQKAQRALANHSVRGEIIVADNGSRYVLQSYSPQAVDSGYQTSFAANVTGRVPILCKAYL